MAIRRTSAATTINRGVTAAAATPVNIITGSGGTGATVNISSIQIANSGFTALDDTAVSTAGGYLIINGTGFQSGASVRIQGTSATSVAFVSSSRLNVTVPAISSGTLDIYVINPDGSGAILISGFVSSGVPSWTTTSPLTQQDASIAFSIQLAATGDGSVTYAVSSGSTLPSGTSLASNGLFSGTVTGIEQETTYTFSVDAIDSQNQETARTFNITVTAGDQYYYLTTLHLSGEAPANNWLTDASTNKFALTVNGDTRPMAFSPYETVWSNFFDGTGDRLSLAGNSAFDISSGNFTIEFWAYSQSNAAVQDFFTLFTSTNSNYAGLTLFISRLTNSTVKVEGASPSIGGGAPAFSITTTATAPIHTWTHVAVTRSGSTFTCWINGVSAGTATFAGTLYWSPPVLYIGSGNDSATNYFTGYISNVRIVKGTAVYTSAFTPPTSPLTAISNTSLLTCQSNRLIDNSTNNFTLTKNGDVLVSNFGPFTETDITTGSGYFDGTGDYLQLSDNEAFDFGTGDFTIECWFVRTATPTSTYHSIFGANGTNFNGWSLYYTSGNEITMFGDAESLRTTSGANIQNNIWYHVAVAKVSGVLKIYVNGILRYTAADTTQYNCTANGWRIGDDANHANGWMNGYISNLRIVKGTAVYSGGSTAGDNVFTPPTSPLTAISGTSILTLQNRFGENNNRFVDSSGFNNLTTRVGNATQGTFSPFSQMGWSNYFDGTGDYLTVASSTAFGLGTDNFTFECWLYPTANPTNGPGTIFDARSGVSAEGYVIRAFNDRTIGIYTATNAYVYSTGTITLNAWNHIALVRTSTATNGLTFYINGVASGTATVNSNLGTSWSPLIGWNRAGTGFEWNGYISNLRLLKGTALYTSNFTPTTSPLTAIANTSLLTCQSRGFIDNSVNNFDITRNGDVSVQAFSPFKNGTITPISYSNYLDGSGDYLDISNNTAFQFGTGDFTVEFWLNTTDTSFNIVGLTTAGSGNWMAVVLSSTFYWQNAYATTNLMSTSGTGILNGAWHHIAITRTGTSFRVFFDGVQQGSSPYTDTANYNGTGTLRIGSGANGDLQGYISNLRILKGTALYTSNFTPPTSPLTAVANTSLLTCQSGSFIDNSTNAFTLTAAGNTSPREYNPFGMTTSSDSQGWSANTVGGSMYFDGTGDYLTVPNNTSLQMGSGDFTIEFWIRYNSITSYQTPFSKGYTAAGDLLLQTGNGNGVMTVWISGSAVITESTGATVGQWYHYALVRKGTTVTLYRNGVSRGTATSSVNFNTTDQLGIGATGKAPGGESVGAFPVNGYMSNVRVIKGTALYTSAFTPPTAPPTPIAGSTLLLSGTNGGIIDYTGRNNLETVGNVQLSTSVKKFGNTSLYFDGTGDYLYIPSSTNYGYGTGDFTIEFWLYLNSTGIQTILSHLSSNPQVRPHIYYSSGVRLYVNGSDVITGGTVTISTWTHIALSRSATSTKLFINGTQSGSTYTDSNNYGTSSPLIIADYSVPATGTNMLNGYISDLRITKGYARYTSNFTAPTSAFKTK